MHPSSRRLKKSCLQKSAFLSRPNSSRVVVIHPAGQKTVLPNHAYYSQDSQTFQARLACCQEFVSTPPPPPHLRHVKRYQDEISPLPDSRIGAQKAGRRSSDSGKGGQVKLHTRCTLMIDRQHVCRLSEIGPLSLFCALTAATVRGKVSWQGRCDLIDRTRYTHQITFILRTRRSTASSRPGTYHVASLMSHPSPH